MKDNKLISMTDFVFEVLNRDFPYNEVNMLTEISNYANFLKQPLKLEMFVPCDDDGNVWEYPPTKEEWEWAQKDSADAEQSFKQKEYYYEKAKEKVLFEDSVLIDKTAFKQTERMMINLKHPATFRIYNQFNYRDGSIQSDFLPNFSEIPTIEYLVSFNLQLTPTAIKQIQL